MVPVTGKHMLLKLFI